MANSSPERLARCASFKLQCITIATFSSDYYLFINSCRDICYGVDYSLTHSLWCEHAGSSLEVKIEADSNDAVGIKTEADSNEYARGHMSSTGRFGLC